MPDPKGRYSERPRCPKDGEINASSYYCEGPNDVERFPKCQQKPTDPPHVHRVCARCQFGKRGEWVELPLDAPTEA